MRRQRGILRVRRYVQLCAAQSELNLRVARFRGGPPAFDGIAEVWYDSWEAFSAAANDPAAQGALRELLQDEQAFHRSRPVCGLDQRNPRNLLIEAPSKIFMAAAPRFASPARIVWP